MSGWTLAWPWALVLILAPWVVPGWHQIFEPRRDAGGPLHVPFLPQGGAAVTKPAKPVRWLWGGCWIFLVLAAARPQWVNPDSPPSASRDFLLAVDVSASMGSQDLQGPDGQVWRRFDAAVRLAEETLARRPKDRVGLIVFGKEAYLHTPMTTDRASVLTALRAVPLGVAGRETAIGDALALAVKVLKESDAAHDSLSRSPPSGVRRVWLLTDGEQSAGQLGVAQAAWLAERAGVTVQTLALGGGKGDEVLQALAKQTGGVFARATDAVGLQQFVRAAEAVEASELARLPREASQPEERYAWPLGAALIFGALLWLWPRLVREGAGA